MYCTESKLNCSKIFYLLPTLLIAVVFLLSASGTALAAGTLSGVTVSLGATADYQVGGISMPQVSTAAPAEFMVDTKIDLTVAETGSNYTAVTPGSQDQILTFTVTNTGNATQDFALAAAVVAVGGDDPIDTGTNTVDFTASGLQAFVDVNSNGVYDAGTDTDYIDGLDPDISITVLVAADIDNTPVHGDVAACTLTATAHDGGTNGSLGALTVENSGSANDTSLIPANADIVFGDGSGLVDSATDGAHSAADAFLITSATLTITKSSAVISDPFSSGNPKMIPGAVVEYTIRVANGSGSGVQNATGILVQDDISAEIAKIAFVADAYGQAPDRGIRIALNGGSYTNLTNASDSPTDEGSFVANVVSVGSIDLTPGDYADIQFRVVVQ
jgi:hypothetical protein